MNKEIQKGFNELLTCIAKIIDEIFYDLENCKDDYGRMVLSTYIRFEYAEYDLIVKKATVRPYQKKEVDEK